MFVRIPKGFLPDSDNDQIMIQTEAEQGISYQEISRYQQMLADIVRRDPAVSDFFSRVSGNNAFGGGSNFGLFFLRLKPVLSGTKSMSSSAVCGKSCPAS